MQRPGVLEAAALDIFLLRRAAGLLAKIPGMSDQWALTLDDWALRFFQVGRGRGEGCREEGEERDGLQHFCLPGGRKH